MSRRGRSVIAAGRDRAGLIAGLLALALVAGACASTNQGASPEDAPNAFEGGTEVAELPQGAHVNKKGQVVNKKGKVIGTAEEFGLRSGTGPGKNSGAVASGRGSGNAGGANGGSASDGGDSSSGGPASQGVGDQTISIGIEVSRSVNQTAEGFGLNIGDVGDQRKQARAVVDYINSKGGIAGRKIEPVYHEVKSYTDSSASRSQASCADFTQDHKVFAAVSPFSSVSTDLIACLAKANTPTIANVASYIPDQKLLAQYRGWWYAPSLLNLTRMVRVYIDGLSRLGYFKKGAKIGLLRFEYPQFDRVTKEVLKPALKKRGLKLTEEFQINSNDQNWPNNAVLRFRSSGVTHVLSLTFGSHLFFMTAAESQNYRPRYGLSSFDTPGVALQATAPKAQLRGSIGVGWWPVYDVDDQHDPNDNPQTKLCLEIMQKAGENTSSRLAQLSMLWYCDTLFFLWTSLERAPALNPEGFYNAVGNLRTRYGSPVTPATDFGPGWQDGAAGYRDFAFSDGCNCFKYTSGIQRIPR